MISEDYCSFEIAKLLKEKGFSFIDHLYMYVDANNRFMIDHSACLTLSTEEYCKHFDELFIPTITHQMAMGWLRENNIIITPQPEYFSCDRCESWGIDIWAFDNYEKLPGDFPTYEEAVEAALKFCLTELI